MLLDSDPEVFDAILSIGFAKSKSKGKDSGASADNQDDADSALTRPLTLAELYYMSKYFAFNLNPASTLVGVRRKN